MHSTTLDLYNEATTFPMLIQHVLTLPPACNTDRPTLQLGKLTIACMWCFSYLVCTSRTTMFARMKFPLVKINEIPSIPWHRGKTFLESRSLMTRRWLLVAILSALFWHWMTVRCLPVLCWMNYGTTGVFLPVLFCEWMLRCGNFC